MAFEMSSSIFLVIWLMFFFGALLAWFILSFIYAAIYCEKISKDFLTLFIKVFFAIALSAAWILIPTTLYLYTIDGHDYDAFNFVFVILFVLCIFRLWALWKQFNMRIIIVLIIFILIFSPLVFFGADFVLG